ncbi:SDR family NAD(P)-dependent oxidoreductase [Arthrobacter sp. zg-Y820]|uniref:SDR family NAD(P)-dependent oxidoreductase n=1 Tax=unclassified Arthrobacter TaxID=235627 RepID=UPI0025420041|nr:MULTISPECIES: SDR family NAD(P)-dependent oxidoreductase [unclassified Arthrobacter]MCC9196515.1 SDR family NAD(P)-dependent oxidoreductase [Arthrobacter sp. zg-Y820]MDK1279377.1 SDR family NAD(P)-dependent oxidoreductase [Arthrobacter sp. zg.Y820]WIB08239.1 SDR family NAD(P)-dependent oxidoreductase [Arthrobacter sp. zg-Y820]
MSERTIVITGASDGIGAAAARSLRSLGNRVVVVGRSPEKTAAVARELDSDYLLADFARLDDVRALAETLLERYPRIDVLANNAGGIMGKREETVDGHEKTLQVNHLAPFLLTNLLLDRLTKSGASVINTSSVANSLFAHFDVDDLEARRKYSPNRAYGNAKLANILFTRELDARYRGQGISAAAFHPGGVASSFAAGSTSTMRVMYRTALNRFLISPDQGAQTLVWLATSVPGEDWQSGKYYYKRKISTANKDAYDAALATRLWNQSAAMVGLQADR